jgi:hypothetical protein
LGKVERVIHEISKRDFMPEERLERVIQEILKRDFMPEERPWYLSYYTEKGLKGKSLL